MSESKSDGSEMNIKVAVRCRPLNDDEKKGNVMSCVRVNPELKKVRVSYGSASKRLSRDYTFDNVFGTYSTQVFLPFIFEHTVDFFSPYSPSIPARSLRYNGQTRY